MTEEAPEPELREGGPRIPSWVLAPGNFVQVYWVNYLSRNAETQGIIRTSGRECIVITPNSTSPVEKGTTINVSRIRHVDVIIESDDAKDIRRRAWELLRESAGYINKRSSWDRRNFLSAMYELLRIFPELKEEPEDEGP